MDPRDRGCGAHYTQTRWGVTRFVRCLFEGFAARIAPVHVKSDGAIRSIIGNDLRIIGTDLRIIRHAAG
jgi:hypothetical protein